MLLFELSYIIVPPFTTASLGSFVIPSCTAVISGYRIGQLNGLFNVCQRLQHSLGVFMSVGGEFGGDPVVVTSNAINVREIIGGPSRVAIFDTNGHPKGTLPTPDPAAVTEVVPLGDGSIVYSVETYTKPRYFARYTAKTGQSVDTQLAQTSPVSFADVEVLREFATSKDGTRVPLNIIRRKGTKLDGSNPTLLNGYGGYAVIDAPYFGGSTMRVWLDGGGVYVIANLRGCSEYGEEWHTQRSLTHKQNGFDDFYASAQYLIAQNYTAPEHLAILGGSNGGLLVGAELNQHPQMFRAVVSLVGIYDMIRVELSFRRSATSRLKPSKLISCLQPRLRLMTSPGGPEPWPQEPPRVRCNLVSSCMLVSKRNYLEKVVELRDSPAEAESVENQNRAACGQISRRLARISDKWTLLVVRALGKGPLRFNALKREVGEISQKMLAATLRELEENGFVSRTVTPTMPPQVEYALTDLGRDLRHPVQALAEWVIENSSRMDAARAAYAAKQTQAKRRQEN